MPSDQLSERPRAVVVSPGPAGSPGGVERSAELVTALLARKGWRVSIACPPEEPPRWAYRVGLGPVCRSRVAASRAIRETPDLIVSNGFLGAGFPQAVPRIHVFHGTLVCASLSMRHGLSKRELLRRMAGGGLAEALSARNATTVAVSQSAARELARFYRVTVDAVLANPVDTAIFRPMSRSRARSELDLPQDRRLALFVGRPDQNKGAHLLLGSTSRAGYELVFAGAGQLPGARSLGVLGPTQLALAYSAADCVLLPSSYEACSFVVLEALACGTPLIATRVGWLRDLLRTFPEYDALCVERREAELTDRLLRLDELAQPGLVESVQRWMVENHGVARYEHRWDQLLRGTGLSMPEPADLSLV